MKLSHPGRWLFGFFWLALLVGSVVFAFFQVSAQAQDPESYFTEEQAREGETAYAQHCASCHGPDLQGISAPALVGETFWQSWGDRMVAELYTYIQSQMPQGRGGSLSTEAYATSTAYVLQQNGFPAGERALEPGATRLADLPLSQEAATEQSEQELPAAPADDQADDQADAQTAAAGETGAEDAPPASEADDADEQEAEVAQDQAQVGNLSLTVLPEAAEVEVAGPAEYQQSFGGGNHQLSGLSPGVYTVTATLAGERLERRIEIAGGEVTQLDLTFDALPPTTDMGMDTETDARTGMETDAEMSTMPERDAPAASTSAAGAVAGVSTDGSALYARHCVMCHGEDGGSGIGPALTSNPRLASDEWVIQRIAGGGLGMPAFGKELAAQELAAVTTYIRTNFGNAYGEVTPQQVQNVVEGLPQARLGGAVRTLEGASVGEQRYVQVCSACHGLQGGGDVGPPMAGNPNLQNEQLVLTTILYGRGQMPAFSLYSDAEIAEIASYIRAAWGNPYGPVAAGEVGVYRTSPPEGGQP